MSGTVEVAVLILGYAHIAVIAIIVCDRTVAASKRRDGRLHRLLSGLLGTDE